MKMASDGKPSKRIVALPLMVVWVLVRGWKRGWQWKDWKVDYATRNIGYTQSVNG